MEIPKFEYLSITGDISVELVTARIPQKPVPITYLIMGPTGAGKSAFIEAFAGKSQKLSISKDQLAGYTQTVTAYRLVNVMHTHWSRDGTMLPVYLIDTPGFSDSKISEIEVMNMVKEWSWDNELHYSAYILYLTPITETRLPGSRRRTFKMLKMLLGGYITKSSLIVTTTMWDTVHNEQTQKRADSNFAQLQDETLTEFVNNPSTDVIKFMNTRNSAFQAFDRRPLFTTVFWYYSTSNSLHLYEDLHDRIQGALQEKHIIELDLAQTEVRTNDNLRAILKQNQRENHKTLTKFINQFINFGKLPPGCRDAAFHLRKSIAANTRPANMNQSILFRIWGLEAESSPFSAGQGYFNVPNTAGLLKDLSRLTLDTSKHCAAKLFKHGE
ncbi:hypothetical protein BJ165DRAFT_1616305 [Panaeolus papilionaceus]|nr:hypothetical protein BJ165DRAFT_1616305 [Panaeolus papilionaceus]